MPYIMIPFLSTKAKDATSVNTVACELKTVIYWLYFAAEHKSSMGKFCLLSCLLMCEVITLYFYLSTCLEYETLIFMSLSPLPVTKITQKDMNRLKYSGNADNGPKQR